MKKNFLAHFRVFKDVVYVMYYKYEEKVIEKG